MNAGGRDFELRCAEVLGGQGSCRAFAAVCVWCGCGGVRVGGEKTGGAQRELRRPEVQRWRKIRGWF